MKSYTTLITDVTDGILIITINREDKLNSLNKTIIGELDEAITELYNNAELKGIPNFSASVRYRTVVLAKLCLNSDRHVEHRIASVQARLFQRYTRRAAR